MNHLTQLRTGAPNLNPTSASMMVTVEWPIFTGFWPLHCLSYILWPMISALPLWILSAASHGTAHGHCVGCGAPDSGAEQVTRASVTRDSVTVWQCDSVWDGDLIFRYLIKSWHVPGGWLTIFCRHPWNFGLIFHQIHQACIRHSTVQCATHCCVQRSLHLQIASD